MMPDPRLIQANTTLLQPGSPFFRISDLISYGVQIAAAGVAAGAGAPVAATVTSLQSQVADLQAQIEALHARLAAAGIA